MAGTPRATLRPLKISITLVQPSLTETMSISMTPLAVGVTLVAPTVPLMIVSPLAVAVTLVQPTVV